VAQVAVKDRILAAMAAVEALQYLAEKEAAGVEALAVTQVMVVQAAIQMEPMDLSARQALAVLAVVAVQALLEECQLTLDMVMADKAVE
jgi:hypothetical protein